MTNRRGKAVPIAPAPRTVVVTPHIAWSNTLNGQSETEKAAAGQSAVGNDSNLPSELHIAQNEYCMELQDLRESHSTLMAQVSALASEVRRTRKMALETDYIVRGPSSIKERTLRRNILFARIAAMKALGGANLELSRHYPLLCPGNSIRQIVLKSKSADCSLYDFRVIASHLSRDSNIQCEIKPSKFHALSCSTTNSDSFEIMFDTFADICEALRIPLDHRIQALYRKRKSHSGEIHCVQVLGIETLTDSKSLSSSVNEDGQRDLPQRRILLARSIPSPRDQSTSQISVLHQHCTN